MIENPPPGLDIACFNHDKVKNVLRVLWFNPNSSGSNFQPDKPLLTFKSSTGIIPSASNLPRSEICFEDNSNQPCQSIRFIFERPIKLKTIGELVVVQTNTSSNEFELISSESNIVSMDLFNMDGLKLSCSDIED